MPRDAKQSYYEVLDVSFNASPEVIRTSYIRAKNAYNRDSLAAYSLFDREESKRVLEEIEEAYTILSDSDKRRQYDESHGIVSSESVYEAYHRGNHAVAAFSRGQNSFQEEGGERFSLEDDPFRRSSSEKNGNRTAPGPVGTSVSSPAATSPAPAGGLSHIEKLKALQEIGQAPAAVKNYQIVRTHEADPAMDERIAQAKDVSGAFLRQVREYKKVSAEEIMNILKIGRNYLTALEEDDVSRLPANVFVRGFVIQYAKALKLDHEKFANAYMEFLKAKRQG